MENNGDVILIETQTSNCNYVIRLETGYCHVTPHNVRYAYLYNEP